MKSKDGEVLISVTYLEGETIINKKTSQINVSGLEVKEIQERTCEAFNEADRILAEREKSEEVSSSKLFKQLEWKKQEKS